MKRFLALSILVLVACQTLQEDDQKSESRLAAYNSESIAIYDKVRDRVFEPVVPFVRKLEWIEPYVDLKVKGKLARLSADIYKNASIHLGMGLGRAVKKLTTKSGESYLTTDNIGLDLGGVITDITNFAGNDLSPLPVRIGLSRKEQIKLTRQYKDFEKAIFAKPFHPKNLPLSADRLVREFPENTLVSFPSEMGVSIGIGQTIRSKSPEVGSFVGMIWTGRYTVNVYKRDSSKAIVSIIPDTSSGFNLSLNASEKLRVFGITDKDKIVEMPSVIDRNIKRAIEQALGFDFLRFGHSFETKGERLVLEYEFDLSKREALDAYDRFFKNTMKVKKNFNPSRSSAKIEKMAIADLDILEKVERGQRRLTAENRAVRRSLRYKDSYNMTVTGGHFGFEPHRARAKKSISTHRLEIQEKSDRESSYSLQRFETQSGINSWIPNQSKNFRYTAHAVTKFEETSPELLGLGFKFIKNDERISDTEFGNFRNSLKSMLSHVWSRHLKIDEHLKPPHTYKAKAADDFRGDFYIGFNVEFLRDVSLSRVEYPNKNDEKYNLTPAELHEKRVYYALSKAYEESKYLYLKPYTSFKTVIPTTWDRFYNWSKAIIVSRYDAVKNFDFHSGEKAALDKVKDIVLDRDLPRRGEVYLAHGLLSTLKDTSSASRLVPGFLVNLCALYESCNAHIELNYRDNLSPSGYSWKNRKTVKMLEIDQLIGKLELALRDPESHYFQ